LYTSWLAKKYISCLTHEIDLEIRCFIRPEMMCDIKFTPSHYDRSSQKEAQTVSHHRARCFYNRVCWNYALDLCRTKSLAAINLISDFFTSNVHFYPTVNFVHEWSAMVNSRHEIHLLTDWLVIVYMSFIFFIPRVDFLTPQYRCLVPMVAIL
jgi:hypothetical protein